MKFVTKNIIPNKTISGLRIQTFEENKRVIFRSWAGKIFPEKMRYIRSKHRFFLLGQFDKKDIIFNSTGICIKGNTFQKNEIKEINERSVGEIAFKLEFFN